MSKCCIGFGKCSCLYFYILLFIVCYHLKRLFSKNEILVMNNHILVKRIYIYFSYILLGSIANYVLNRNLNKTEKNKINDINSQTLSSESTYKNTIKLSKFDKFSIIIICFIYVIYIESIKIIQFFDYESLNIWTIKVVYTLIFMNHYFPQDLYKHKIFSMTIIIVLCVFLKVFVTFLDNHINIYQEKGILVCFDIFIIYNFLSFIISFAQVKIKDFIDRKYISLYFIIMLIGIIGLIITSISALFFYLFGKYCNDNLKMHLYCYGDSLSYFDELKDIFINNKNLSYIKIILITPIYLFIEFLFLTFSILIIKYLNPIYLLLSENIYNLTYDIDDYINENNYNNYIKFIISEISEISQIIAFLIYLEIIELRFCGLSENIRKNIIIRGENDFKNKDIEDDSYHINKSSILIEEYKINMNDEESMFNE